MATYLRTAVDHIHNLLCFYSYDEAAERILAAEKSVLSHGLLLDGLHSILLALARADYCSKQAAHLQTLRNTIPSKGNRYAELRPRFHALPTPASAAVAGTFWTQVMLNEAFSESTIGHNDMGTGTG